MFVTNPHYVFVNSRDRIAGTDEDFTYNIDLPSGIEFTHVVCLNALIPKSYYLIQNGLEENSFKLQENNTTVIIKVPVGNYLLSAFKKVISELLTANSPNGLIYSMTYPLLSGPDTGKWTFTQNNASVISSLIFNQHLFEPFGFLAGSTNIFNGVSIESTCVIKLQSEDRLLIHSDIVSNPGKEDVLVSINSTTSINYSSINYLCPAPEFYSRAISSNNNSTYKFSLSDENGELIQLNGLNLNFTLLLYKKDPIFDQIRALLRVIAAPPQQTMIDKEVPKNQPMDK